MKRNRGRKTALLAALAVTVAVIGFIELPALTPCGLRLAHPGRVPAIAKLGKMALLIAAGVFKVVRFYIKYRKAGRNGYIV